MRDGQVEDAEGLCPRQTLLSHASFNCRERWAPSGIESPTVSTYGNPYHSTPIATHLVREGALRKHVGKEHDARTRGRAVDELQRKRLRILPKQPLPVPSTSGWTNSRNSSTCSVSINAC